MHLMDSPALVSPTHHHRRATTPITMDAATGTPIHSTEIRPKRAFTIESLISPDVTRSSKKRAHVEENPSMEFVHTKKSKSHHKSSIQHQTLPPISQALPHSQVAHLHLLEHQNHMQALHNGIDFNFHPHLHPHQFPSAYMAAAAAAQSGLGHLPYDLPVHPLLMMASGPMNHQYFNQSIYPSAAAALSLQQQIVGSPADLSRINGTPLRTV